MFRYIPSLSLSTNSPRCLSVLMTFPSIPGVLLPLLICVTRLTAIKMADSLLTNILCKSRTFLESPMLSA